MDRTELLTFGTIGLLMLVFLGIWGLIIYFGMKGELERQGRRILLYQLLSITVLALAALTANFLQPSYLYISHGLLYLVFLLALVLVVAQVARIFYSMFRTKHKKHNSRNGNQWIE